MSEYSLPDMWDIADEGETTSHIQTSEEGLEYMLDVEQNEGLFTGSFSGFYAEAIDDGYRVAVLDGSTDGFLAGGRAEGTVFDYETEIDDPDELRLGVQQAYLDLIAGETLAMLEAMHVAETGTSPQDVLEMERDSFVATRREDLERVYDEAF